MKMAEERIVPISSDECGDDSDEDIVTDYISGPTLALGESQGSVGGPLGAPLVPTISVTPHSPGGKHCAVLEDTLAQLQEIRDSVQRMCGGVVQASNPHVIFPNSGNLEASARLSASCPVLEQDASNSPPGGLSWLHGNSRLGPGGLPNHERRSSWTALEDLTRDKMKPHRSISLSSLDSEPDSSATDILLAPHRVASRNVARVQKGRGAGGVSTHSLNEADLQNDFNKILALREAQSRLAPVRLPLQKSVSTPSIAPWAEAVVKPPEPHVTGVLPICRPGTESETEEEPPDISLQTPAPDLGRLLAQSYDQHSEKRRKRGSLFFRKKKDKDKDKERVAPERTPHIWGSTVSHGACDWCSKALGSKPQVTCENCGICVHYSSCKDHLSDCKGKASKGSKSSTIASIQTTKQSSGKRGSFTTAPPNSKKMTGCYSPWRRVATKLGVNGGHDDRDLSHLGHEGSNFSDEAPLVRLEFLDESPPGPRELCDDPLLRLCSEEPDSWTPTATKDILKQLKDKQIKRQEHIYEFILTEKHHCLTLIVMQKVFVEGLQKHFQLGNNLERMFPRLPDLTELHLGFMRNLRLKQREGPVVDSLSDILLEMFSGIQAQRLKDAYGEFCSRHRDALETYKCHMSNDSRFCEFIRHCQATPQLKKKGVPECVLFVTQRLTKYPLLIEPLIKSSRDNLQEQEKLKKALALVKEILVEVDARVAEKEKEDRKLDIYHRIDAKSYTVQGNRKFKKSDVLAVGRRLRFEGLAMLMQGRGKMQHVLVVVLSDCLFFLQESSHKYSFFTPDNKTGVVSLQKLLVREKAGQDGPRGIYLISSNPSDPEMFELKVDQPKDKAVWIQAIRNAVRDCPQTEEEGFALSAEERHKLLEAKQAHIRQIAGALRQKDVEHALLLEEKMSLQLKLLAAAGLQGVPEPPQYRNLVTDAADTGEIWLEVLGAVQEVSQLASSLYAAGSSLSRSVSSAGERHSEAYESPTLPKRAETFGGFDNPNLRGLIKKFPQREGNDDTIASRLGQKLPLDRLPWRSAVLSTVPAGMLSSTSANGATNTQGSGDSLLNALTDTPALLSLGREQQKAAVQLSHYVYTLLCIISQQMTTISSLQAQIAAYQGSGAPAGATKYKHNDQLEELRNLQDKLQVEKEAWQRERLTQETDLKQERDQLLALQEQVKAEQEDVRQQRDQLYRKMEVLSSQGLLLSPSVALPHVGHTGSSQSAGSSEDGISTPTGFHQEYFSDTGDHHSTGTTSRKEKWKTPPTKPSLPLNLISATNQPKIQQTVKQQIPLKLSCLGSTSSTPSPQGSTISASGVQQMLPLKLSQNLGGGGLNCDNTYRRSSSGQTTPGGGYPYQRLSSGSFSPPQYGEALPLVGHSRTGSSPAMMQATPPSGGNSQQGGTPTSTHSSGGAKPGRTNTYPKIPDRFKVRSPQETVPAEEEVIFF